MRRTRLLSVAAAVMVGALALAGCAEDAETPTTGASGTDDSASSAPAEQSDVQVGIAFDVGGEGDKSFNDAAVAGLTKAIDEFGVTATKVSPNADGSNRAELLSQLAEQGFDPVIAVGFAYDETIAQVAADFPDTTFAQIDGANSDGAKGTNVTGLLFAEEQGSFLAGVAAALKTQTDHVGFIGGVEIGLIQKFEAGFTAGAQAVNPDITVDVEYITPAGNFGGFSDPARANILATGMYDNGADIIYTAAGGSGVGSFEAARDSDGLAIGVDSDQYETIGDATLQPVIMTSMLKRVDVAVYEFISAFLDGPVEGGTDITYDLSVDGVGLATSGGQIDDIQTDIADYQQQIVDGDIEVPTTP